MFKRIIRRLGLDSSFRKSLRFSPLFFFLLWTFAHSPSIQARCRSSFAQPPSQQQSTVAQSTAEPTTLEIGIPVERELAGLQEHGYQVTLDQGQYARVVVEQRGTDALVQLLGVDGKSIIDFDAEMRAHGEEKVEFVAPTSAKYRLLVKGKYPKLPAGRYEIRLVEVRSASENERLLDEARRLRSTAWRLRMADKYAEAFPLAERVLELQERVLGPEHPDLTYTLFVLAVISEFRVEWAKAEAFYLRGQKNAEKTLGSDHPLLARILSSSAYHYFRHRGDYARAEPLYQRGLSIREKALGSHHPEVAKSVKDLGFLYIDLGDYLRAETALQRALMINEKAFGEEDVEVALTLTYLASLYNQKGDYLKAEPLFQRSLNYWEETFGPDHGWVAIGLNNLANFYVRTGDYDKAEPLFRRVLSISEKYTDRDDRPVLMARHNLAEVYYGRGDYAKALILSSGVLPGLEKVFGPNHRVVGLHSHLLAKVHIALRDHTKARTTRSPRPIRPSGGRRSKLLQSCRDSS